MPTIPIAFLATYWSFVAVCFGLVCIRLYVQLTTRVRPWRELLLVFAWFCMLADCTLNHVILKLKSSTVDGNGVSDDHPTILDAKLIFTTELVFMLGIAACKAVLLMMCNDLCHRHTFPKTWWLIAVTWALLIVFILGFNSMMLFLVCYPRGISAFGPRIARCIPFKIFFSVGVISILLVDILSYIIPIIVVFSLGILDLMQKVGVAAMFAVGFVNVASGILLLVAASLGDKVESIAFNTMISTAETLQLPTAIMILCIPQLRIIGRWALTKKVVSTIISIQRHTSRSSPGGLISDADEQITPGRVDVDIEFLDPVSPNISKETGVSEKRTEVV